MPCSPAPKHVFWDKVRAVAAGWAHSVALTVEPETHACAAGQGGCLTQESMQICSQPPLCVDQEFLGPYTIRAPTTELDEIQKHFSLHHHYHH